MALTVKTITIKDGRDAGKTFVITEMPARPAYDWSLRAIFALMNAGFEVPDDIAGGGMASIAALGIKALGKAHYDDMKPLLDEMLACVVIVPDPSRPNITRSDIDRDIEDVKTFFVLQKEALMVHVAPFIEGVKSNGALTPPQAPAG